MRVWTCVNVDVHFKENGIWWGGRDLCLRLPQALMFFGVVRKCVQKKSSTRPIAGGLGLPPVRGMEIRVAKAWLP